MKSGDPQGFLVVVSSPSGGGKSSVLNEVIDRHPDLRFSVSVTTRHPREGERDGVNYFFVTDSDFDAYIENGEFLEWALVHGNRYGTLLKTVHESVENGNILFLDTDTVGAFNIKKQVPDAVLIFIAPPSPEVLRDRLESRNTDADETIKRRLDAAPREMEQASNFDYIVVNDTLPKAVDEIHAIITAEKQKSDRIIPSLHAWRI